MLAVLSRMASGWASFSVGAIYIMISLIFFRSVSSFTLFLLQFFKVNGFEIEPMIIAIYCLCKKDST
jgi:hypothetical protein